MPKKKKKPVRIQTKRDKNNHQMLLYIIHMFELSENNFKTAIKNLLWWTIINIPEINEQIESLDKEIEGTRENQMEI